MFKKKAIVGKFNNHHFWILVAAYFGMSMLQIGLPERFESTRQTLSLVQIIMLGFLSLMTVINLFRNWK